MFNAKIAVEGFRGFTLLEALIVIIIIGISAALGLPNYSSYKERTLNKEAQASLRLVKAAERVYKLENKFYYPYSATPPGSTSVVTDINSFLKLQLTTANWNYKIDNAANTTFTGKAQRVTDATRVWCIDQGQDVPYTASCSW